MEIESLSPPVQGPGHPRGPPRDIAGPICIAIEALMVLANTLPIFVSIFFTSFIGSIQIVQCCTKNEIRLREGRGV